MLKVIDNACIFPLEIIITEIRSHYKIFISVNNFKV